MKIHTAEEGVVVKGQVGVGAGEDMETTNIKIMAGMPMGAKVVDKAEIGAIKIMVGMQTGAKVVDEVEIGAIKIMVGMPMGAKVVDEAEIGAIKVLDMREAEGEGAEVLGVAVDVDGWVAALGAVATSLSWELTFFALGNFVGRTSIFMKIWLLSEKYS